MQTNLFFDTTDSDDDINRAIEVSMRDVSISSIKTQDSIENNSMTNNLDEEERKESETENFRNSEFGDACFQLPPFVNFKEAQQAIIIAMACPKIKLEIKPLYQILGKLHKISEDYQAWKKQD